MESTSTSPQSLSFSLHQTPTRNSSVETVIDLSYFYETEWPAASTEHLNGYSDIFEYCYHQLYPEITNYDEKDHVILICDNCNLSQEGMQELFSDQTCLASDLNPMALFIVLFSAIFVFGAFGNLITLIAGIKARKMNPSVSAMFLFISNLAAGDFLMVVLCVPATFVSTYYLHYWPFQKFVCVAVSYAQAVSVFVSAYSLVAISIDRYIAILYPPHNRITRRQAWAILATVWVMALITCVPVALYSDLVIPENPYYVLHNVTVCTEAWPTHLLGLRQGYSIALLVLHYFLPVAVMIFTYSRIACKIWSSSKKFKTIAVGKGRPGGPPSPTSHSIPIKTIRMSLTVVLVYSLCWLPYNVLIVLTDYNEDLLEVHGSQYLYAVLYWLAMLHTVLNIVLIYLLNPPFRAAILRVLYPFISPCCKGPVEDRLQKLEHFNSSIRFRRNTLRTSVSMATHLGVNNNTSSVVRCVKALPSDDMTAYHANGSTRRSDSIRSTSTRSTSVRAYDDIASPATTKVLADEYSKFDFSNCHKPSNQDAKNCKDAAAAGRKGQVMDELEKPRGSIVKMFAPELQDETRQKLKEKCEGDGQEMGDMSGEKGRAKCRKVDAESTAPYKMRGLKNLFVKKRKDTKKKETEDTCRMREELFKDQTTCFLERNTENSKNVQLESDEIEIEDDVFV